jgi:hypothetical protein
MGYDFNMIYLQVVEGERPDVAVVPAFGQLTSRIADPEIRSLAPLLAQEHISPSASTHPLSASQAVLAMSRALAEAIDWRRPVYCNVDTSRAPTDPHVRSVWWNLFRIDREQTEVLAPRRRDSDAVELGDGISLARVEVQPDAVRPHDLMKLTFDWVCADPITQAPFVAIRLSPAGDAGAPRRGMRQDYPTWFAHGIAPLAATPPGMVYRQELVAMAPTNADPGAWQVWVAVASGPNAEMHFWRVKDFQVLPPE